MTFAELAMHAISGKMSVVEQRLCPDQYVGKIGDLKEEQPDFQIRKSASSRPAGIKCLLMVIESPHTQEFEGEPGPAKGNTGKLIRKWITNVLGSQYRSYGLILINAIQHQCSLGLPTRCFRDEVFETVWSLDGEREFVARLVSLFRKGDVVVNCCTRGNMRGRELRQAVHATIMRANICHEPLRRTHPSSWHSKKNRKHVWPEQF